MSIVDKTEFTEFFLDASYHFKIQLRASASMRLPIYLLNMDQRLQR